MSRSVAIVAAVAIAIVVASSACASDGAGDALTADATVPTSADAGPVPTDPAATTTSATAAEVVTSAPVTEPTTPAIDANSFDLPTGIEVEDVAIGEEIVVVAWMEGAGQILWRVGDPIDAAIVVSDLFADESDSGQSFVAISDVVTFDGRYVAFVMGDENGDDRSPTTMISDDGTTWERTTATVVSGSRGAPTTPDSPPYPGPSAVVDAVVDDGHVYATGWATIDDRIRAVVWDSTDGERWRLEVLPDQGTGTEYGSRIGRSDLGTIVRIGGGFHSGIATVTATTRGEWVTADNPNPDAIATQVGVNDGSFYELVPRFEDGSVLHVSDDGTTWTAVDVPDAEGTDALPSLGVDGGLDPIVVTDSLFTGHDSIPMRAWVLDRGEWTAQRLLGTRIVSIDTCHIVTSVTGTLFVAERPGDDSC